MGTGALPVESLQISADNHPIGMSPSTPVFGGGGAYRYGRHLDAQNKRSGEMVAR